MLLKSGIAIVHNVPLTSQISGHALFPGCTECQ